MYVVYYYYYYDYDYYYYGSNDVKSEIIRRSTADLRTKFLVFGGHNT